MSDKKIGFSEPSDGRSTGGSGGGPTAPARTHDDTRYIDGPFTRVANKIGLLAVPDAHETRDSCSAQLLARGSDGWVKVNGEHCVVIRTGGIYEDLVPDSIGLCGITLFAPDAAQILIQRGNFLEPTSQTIEMKSDGTINVNAGETGTINLTAGGNSSIQIAPDGITIKGPLVRIN